MRGVSIPTHRYADMAQGILQEGRLHDSSLGKALSHSTRAYTRVVLRLRAQAEAELKELTMIPPNLPNPDNFPKPFIPNQPSHHIRTASRASSRASSFGQNFFQNPNSPTQAPIQIYRPKFRSALYRPHHAPLLRVFVPSPEGQWLSDSSVFECERELRRALAGPKGSSGMSLLRPGDVVWDAAVSDEANVAKLIWDGNYLIDLDYTYSLVGSIPRYFHSFSFPPSYFHKVIRSGVGADGDPIVQIDVNPWAHEIAAGLELLQERVAMDTPNGGRHSVLRWSHRSRFRIPMAIRTTDTLSIPIPQSDNLFINRSWAGIVVVEAEGTNEGLEELHSRCPAAFPDNRLLRRRADADPLENRAWRLLRERSRPGEIWIRVIREKEKLI
ncbi:hypothetical protein SISNIDRAFT_415892 [Sistotremastrum niveocremeum HHB9708]|uniref:Uncharacterized protein n=1 Tax=Sistotremastrum niveocremeum HHB9708 TaxID=1314777 RepID=A0A164R0K6_9AGAM|nr:hypothetical protein SISNIDRAFT_415892 [Sistotremastrum niveocremeum HHB9708]